MPDESISPTISKTDVKLSMRKNVIPITSISDLGTIVGDIQNQLSLLISKLESDVSPEFKALMEGYVNKANEAEEFKVNLENIKSAYEEIKAEIAKVRDTNRSLVNELQNAREVLKRLEQELNTHQESSKKSEEAYKDKIKMLTKQNSDYENKVKQIEEEKLKTIQELEAKISELTENQEKLRQELLDQTYNSHQQEQKLVIEKDNAVKHMEELETMFKEQAEKLELKIKESEYKDALLNQLIKQATTEKLKTHKSEDENLKDKQDKKRKSWFF